MCCLKVHGLELQSLGIEDFLFFKFTPMDDVLPTALAGSSESDPPLLREYDISSLLDGTLIEVPGNTVAPLLLVDSATGNYTVGPEAMMEYRSFFLRTMTVEGKNTRVFEGIFGDRYGVLSFVAVSEQIFCQVIRES